MERLRLLDRVLRRHRLLHGRVFRLGRRRRKHRHGLPHHPLAPDPPDLPHRQVPEAVVYARVRLCSGSHCAVLGHLPDDLRAVRLLHHARPHRGTRVLRGPAGRVPAQEVRQHRARHAHALRADVFAELGRLRGGDVGQAEHGPVHYRLHHLRELRDDRLADRRDQREHVREEQPPGGGGAHRARAHAQDARQDLRGPLRRAALAVRGPAARGRPQLGGYGHAAPDRFAV
mmetsp:Transcript_68952/g.211534  ORF Transcript_68952/g.211534 Transcript_68952/m.211534 type:complete len:230 (+) Transcript_68952:534-1223(+)